MKDEALMLRYQRISNLKIRNEVEAVFRGGRQGVYGISLVNVRSDLAVGPNFIKLAKLPLQFLIEAGVSKIR